MFDVVSIVLKKKELKGVSADLVLSIIKKNLDNKISRIINEKRFKTRDFKDFVKVVRAQLRRQYGAFQNPKIDRMALVKNRKYTDLLMSHQSSRERFEHYPMLYKQLWSITGKPGSIIDIGCGMNPLSYEFMGLDSAEYLALDISLDDLKIISEYFRQRKINGEVRVFDAVRSVYDFKKYDVCFCFKLFEILETSRSHRLTEDIVKVLKVKWLIASFSTKTLSGAPMTRKRRVWFEVMLKRLKLGYETVEFPGELFYVIKKGF